MQGLQFVRPRSSGCTHHCLGVLAQSGLILNLILVFLKGPSELHSACGPALRFYSLLLGFPRWSLLASFRLFNLLMKNLLIGAQVFGLLGQLLIIELHHV